MITLLPIELRGRMEPGNDEIYHQWILALASERVHGVSDRLGTANLIDRDARLRGRDSIESGGSVRLSRTLPKPQEGVATEWAFGVTTRYEPFWRVSGKDAPLGFAVDHIGIACHGYDFTHMDALNHVSLEGTFYGGSQWGTPSVPSVADIAQHCFFTRAVFADIPTVRGTEWVADDQPVTGDDIEAAIATQEFAAGDALLLFMGRNEYEAAGNTMTRRFRSDFERRPGVGRDGAKWIADHGVSVLCWDLQDAVHEDEPASAVHQLVFAIGLAVVDNCDLAPAAAALRSVGKRAGALSVQPIAYPDGTGSVVEPVLIF